MARAKTNKGSATEAEDPNLPDQATQLHAILAAYFSALASLKAPPPAVPTSGLNAVVYWADYFAAPDHIPPQDIPFVRGRIWS
jgi:hypothetical protein